MQERPALTVSPKRRRPSEGMESQEEKKYDDNAQDNDDDYLFAQEKGVQLRFHVEERNALVKHLMRVQAELALSDEVVFLSVNLMDRIFSSVAFPEAINVKLATATALWIATKYDDQLGQPQEVLNHFVQCSFTPKQFCTMELAMLHVLGWKLSAPTLSEFFQRLRIRNLADPELVDCVGYLCRLSLLNANLSRFKPSHVAAAALRIALSLLPPTEHRRLQLDQFEQTTRWTVFEIHETQMEVWTLVSALAHKAECAFLRREDSAASALCLFRPSVQESD